MNELHKVIIRSQTNELHKVRSQKNELHKVRLQKNELHKVWLILFWRTARSFMIESRFFLHHICLFDSRFVSWKDDYRVNAGLVVCLSYHEPCVVRFGLLLWVAIPSQWQALSKFLFRFYKFSLNLQQVQHRQFRWLNTNLLMHTTIQTFTIYMHTLYVSINVCRAMSSWVTCHFCS